MGQTFLSTSLSSKSSGLCSISAWNTGRSTDKFQKFFSPSFWDSRNQELEFGVFRTALQTPEHQQRQDQGKHPIFRSRKAHPRTSKSRAKLIPNDALFLLQTPKPCHSLCCPIYLTFCTFYVELYSRGYCQMSKLCYLSLLIKPISQFKNLKPFLERKMLLKNVSYVPAAQYFYSLQRR